MPRRTHLLGLLLASLVFCPSIPQAQNSLGAIWGTITDENGEPLVGWSVKAYRVRNGAIRRFASGEDANQLTDQQGRYVIDLLEPGEYLVGAARAVRAEPSAFHSQESAPYSPASVTVTRSEQVRGIGIRVVPRPRIFGTVTTATGTPLLPEVKDTRGFTLRGEIYLTPAPRPGVIRLNDRTVKPDTNGRFQFDDVLPGEYALTAQIMGYPVDTRCDHRVAQLSHEFVVRTIAVSGDDVGPLRLTTTSGSMQGRIVFEGQSPPPASADLTLEALQRGPETWSRSGGQVWSEAFIHDDGRFDVRGVAERAILVASSRSGWWMKSIRTTESLPSAEPIAKDTAGIEIVMADGAAALETRVFDRANRTRGTVYLFSTNDRWWFNSKFFYLPVVRRATSADQYVFDSLPPGDYYLVALRAEDDVALRLEEAQGHPAPDEMDAAMLRRLAPFARRITLAERQRATIDIPLSPLP